MASGKRGREQWEEIINRWRASGMSMAAYGRQHELSYTALVRWRRRLARSGEVTPALTLIPLMTPAPSRGPMVIRLSGGIGIEVEPGFDAGLLRAVVGVLQESVRC